MTSVSTNAFFDEIEKISQSVPDDKITKERAKRFLRYGAEGAAGTGLGFGASKLFGRPIEKKLVEMGMRKGPAKVLRYVVPMAMGTGAGLALARSNLSGKLMRKIRGEDVGDNSGHPKTRG